MLQPIAKKKKNVHPVIARVIPLLKDAGPMKAQELLNGLGNVSIRTLRSELNKACTLGLIAKRPDLRDLRSFYYEV